MARTLTSANSSLVISVPGVFANPQVIQGYATDDAWDTENVKPNETMMGVDGNLSGGHTPYPVPLKIVLQADSDSVDVFDIWRQAEDAADEAFQASATLTVPGSQKVYSYIKGFLTSTKPSPNAKKVLGPQNFEITFQQVIASPTA